MDIVIKNGKINFEDMQKEHKRKNEEGLLKKDFNTFDITKSGPYYDLNNAHLHIWRKPKYILNFHGRQDQKMIKLVERPWKDNESYCAICHERAKQNTAFDSNNNFQNLKKGKRINNTSITEIQRDYTCKWKHFYNIFTDRKVLIESIKTKRVKI